MIPRAEWRVRPDDPKTPLGWTFGADRYRGVPLYPAFAGAVVLMALLSKACAAWLPLGIGEAASSILPMLPVFLLVVALRQDRQEILAPDPAPGRTHAGSVRVAVGEREMGEDRGVVAFNEGWLLFEGARTSFALSRGDVGRSRRIGDERRLELTDGHRLRISGTGGLAADYDLWYAGPAATGLSRFPPTDVYPKRRARTAAYLQLASAGLMGVGVGGLLTGGSLRATLIVLLLSGLLALATRLLRRLRLT